MNDEPRLCAACGDPAAHLHQGKPYCRECYDELAFGKIRFNPKYVEPGKMNGRYGPRYDDDPSPYTENAVRHMED